MMGTSMDPSPDGFHKEDLENLHSVTMSEPESTVLKSLTHPRTLSSVEEFECIIKEWQARSNLVKHANITTSSSGREPIYPTFTRFSSTRLSNAEMASYSVRPSEREDCGALFDLEYPIVLFPVDRRGVPISGCPAKGVIDSMGYPLLYDSEKPRKIVRTRPSRALYPINISRSLTIRSSRIQNKPTIQTWKQMFALEKDLDAHALLERAAAWEAGDNHIALLVKAYLIYLDSIAGALEGVECRTRLVSPTDVVINISTRPGWLRSILSSPFEFAIVNVLGGSPGYQEFWAHCCFPIAPAYTCTTSNDGVVASTLFSHYEMNSFHAMKCLCDTDVYSAQRTPDFFGRPSLVLGYIETYVQKFGLQQQANEALQIAMLWPTMFLLKAHISLPKPHHIVDWMGGNSGGKNHSIKTCYSDLISSNPLVILASTLAGACAVRSQIYDFITLLSTKRTTWTVGKETVQICATWLTSHLSAPGLAWDFLLRHQFHVSPSFLYLTGLSTEAIHWPHLLSTFTWKEAQFPAHLRLIQPFWVTTSICCQLPWEELWTPLLEVTGHTVTACVQTLMRLLRLGLLASREDSTTAVQTDYSQFYPVLDRDGDESINVSKLDLELLRATQVSGLRVQALYIPHSPHFEAPLRGNAFRECQTWVMGGLLQNVTIAENRPDALQAPEIPHHPRALVNPLALEAALARVERIKLSISQRMTRITEETEQLLVTHASHFAPCPNQAANYDGVARVLYSPKDRDESGWWCLLYLFRTRRKDHASMACLRQRLVEKMKLESMPPVTLSPHVMAGLCVLLELNVMQISFEDDRLCANGRDEDSRCAPTGYTLRYSAGQWDVLGDAVPEIADITFQMSPRNGGPDAPVLALDLTPQANEDTQPKCASYNLTTRARLLDQLINLWDQGLETRENVVAAHRVLFPAAGMPRFLSKLRATQPSYGEPTPAGSVFIDSSEEQHPVLQHLKQRHGSAAQPISLVLQRLVLDLSHLDGSRWPHRSAKTANKNNIVVADLIEVLDPKVPQEALALWFIKDRQGNHTEYVASVALWLSGLDICPSAWSELLQSGLLDQNEDKWLSHSQQVHDGWRKEGLHSCVHDGCWTQLLYPQALYGRGGIEVDWIKEISKKSQPPDDILAYTGHSWSADYASELIRNTVREVLLSASRKLRILDFDAFIDNAYEWLVGGSTAGIPSAFKGTPVRALLQRLYGLSGRPTKRSVMETIPREHILRQLRTRPQIVAKLHQKLNETGGKARAIYGVTLWHYIFSNWLMAPFEKAIEHDNVDINISNDKFVALQVRRAQGAKRSAFFSSYDYPDFNSMHTHYHMSMIYEEASKIARSSQSCLSMDPDKLALINDGYEWLRESVFTQVCYLPLIDDFIQTVGGLYSGNRDTTLINTILNIAYAKVVDVSCQNMGLDPTVNWRLCHGDDIITEHENYGAALAWNLVADHAKLKGQEKKLLTDRAFHEYLRIMGCADGKLRGSVARVVATFVNGNWETDYTAGSYAQITELFSALAVLQRRGMRADLCRRLRRRVVENLIAAIKPDDADAERLKSSLSQLLQNPTIKLSSTGHEEDLREAEAESEIHDLFRENIRRSKGNIESLFRQLPAHVTEPYEEMLLSLLPFELQEQSSVKTNLHRMLQKSTYGSELPPSLQVEVKQSPLIVNFANKVRLGEARRGKREIKIDITDVDRILDSCKVFATGVRRIKALHILLSSLDDLMGYTKTDLISHLTEIPKAMVQNILLTEQILETDWRRVERPSAAEVASLENQLELYMTSTHTLDLEEEVVVYADNGNNEMVPLRNIMLY